MATFYVVEMRRDQNDNWSDELGEPPDSVNYFKTRYEAWDFVDELQKLGQVADGSDDGFNWAAADYRVAQYAGEEDHERVQSYFEDR